MSPKNLIDIAEMFKSYGDGLSSFEKNYIARAKRGQGLFFVTGFNRHMISIKHSEIESYAYDNFQKLRKLEDFNEESYKEKLIYEIENQIDLKNEKTKNILNVKKMKKEKQKSFQQKLEEENKNFINKL